jgi:hypothetical protein
VKVAILQSQTRDWGKRWGRTFLDLTSRETTTLGRRPWEEQSPTEFAIIKPRVVEEELKVLYHHWGLFFLTHDTTIHPPRLLIGGDSLPIPIPLARVKNLSDPILVFHALEQLADERRSSSKRVEVAG